MTVKILLIRIGFIFSSPVLFILLLFFRVRSPYSPSEPFLGFWSEKFKLQWRFFRYISYQFAVFKHFLYIYAIDFSRLCQVSAHFAAYGFLVAALSGQTTYGRGRDGRCFLHFRCYRFGRVYCRQQSDCSLGLAGQCSNWLSWLVGTASGDENEHLNYSAESRLHLY